MDSTTPVVFQEIQSAPGQAAQSEKSIERSQQADQQSYHCWTSEEIENTIYLWEELVSSQVDMKFSAFGASTLPVPTFLSHNVQKVVSSASAQDYQYANITGRSDLVEAILTKFPETKKLQTEQRQLKPSNVLVTMGAINGIQATIEALCSPGDEIIVFEPVYQNHLIAFVNSNVVFKSVKMIFNEKTKKLEFDFETLKNALSAKTKVLLIINPNNPGTRIFTEEEYLKISEIIEDYPNLTVIEDQAYSIYHEDGQKVIPFATIKPSNFDKTVTFFSAGKMFNITGTRVGFCIGAERIISKVGEWFRFKSHFTPALEQMITRENLISATEKDEESRDFYEATRQDISSKMNKIKEELTKYGVNVLPYEGTYYILLDIENQRERVEDKYYYRHHDSNTRTKGLDQAFCRAMLSKYGVGLFALSPLYTGENCPDNIVRVSANRNDNDLQLLFDAFKDFYGLV